MKKLKLLLIDDSTLMLQFLSDLLVSQGLDIIRATTLAEAVDLYTCNCPEIVMSDFILGGGTTGLDLLEVISSASVAQPHRAAILTQGKLSHGDEQRALKMGARVFQKPIQGTEKHFLNEINEWLKSVRA